MSPQELSALLVELHDGPPWRGLVIRSGFLSGPGGGASAVTAHPLIFPPSLLCTLPDFLLLWCAHACLSVSMCLGVCVSVHVRVQLCVSVCWVCVYACTS